MFSDSYGNNDSPCQSRGCWLWLQEAERGGVCKSPGEHGQNSSKRTVPKKHCPVIPWPEHARLVVGKVGRCDFWNLARLQNKIGEATSPDPAAPTLPREGPIPGLPLCEPQQTDQHDLHKVSLVLSDQHLSVGRDCKHGFRVTVH